MLNAPLVVVDSDVGTDVLVDGKDEDGTKEAEEVGTTEEEEDGVVEGTEGDDGGIDVLLVDVLVTVSVGFVTVGQRRMKEENGRVSIRRQTCNYRKGEKVDELEEGVVVDGARAVDVLDELDVGVDIGLLLDEGEEDEEEELDEDEEDALELEVEVVDTGESTMRHLSLLLLLPWLHSCSGGNAYMRVECVWHTEEGWQGKSCHPDRRAVTCAMSSLLACPREIDGGKIEEEKKRGGKSGQ